MNKLLSLLLTASLFVSSCKGKHDYTGQIKEIKSYIENGNLTKSQSVADSLKKLSDKYSPIWMTADSLKQITERIRLDFSIPENRVIEQVKALNGPFTVEDMQLWERNGWLEWRLIDGVKMYFNRAASNLMLIKSFHENRKRWQQSSWNEPEIKFRLMHTKKIYRESESGNSDPEPVIMNATYTLTVHPDVVPAGDTIRCWLPFPAEGHPRQYGIKLTNVSEKDYIIAPDTSLHSTIYLEKPAEKGKPTVFSVSYKYISCGGYTDLTERKILPYRKSSPQYMRYTSEQPPQINFSNDVKKLADSITGPNDGPYETVYKIYSWFKQNIPWAGAQEYSIMPDIPGYVADHRRGDCGMQTLLFMSMLRYKGIPVRWQSGWMVPPGAENLHDWCEVYYEGVGWVP
ncbi:MAG TPA: transglutaminase-like domain-containing protein, partial [Bacteroidales bacterium]|nr:transglutaminase-like domain-containing protein [Bacteroidales bacterium]